MTEWIRVPEEASEAYKERITEANAILDEGRALLLVDDRKRSYHYSALTVDEETGELVYTHEQTSPDPVLDGRHIHRADPNEESMWMKALPILVVFADEIEAKQLSETPFRQFE